MTDHNLGTSENKSSIYLITNVDGYTLLVFKDSHGYQWRSRLALREIFHSAASASAKGREWILELMEDEDELGLDRDFEHDPDE